MDGREGLCQCKVFIGWKGSQDEKGWCRVARKPPLIHSFVYPILTEHQLCCQALLKALRHSRENDRCGPSTHGTNILLGVTTLNELTMC